MQQRPKYSRWPQLHKTQLHLGAFSRDGDDLLQFKPIRTGKKGDGSDTERGCWCQTCCIEYFTFLKSVLKYIAVRISDFHTQTNQSFAEDGSKNTKYPVGSSCQMSSCCQGSEVRLATMLQCLALGRCICVSDQ